MPKTNQFESVLHDWVHGLSFQMQALLLTGMRGPDGSSKHNVAKVIVRYLRGVVIKPAGDWHEGNDNDFMWGEWDKFENYVQKFWKNHDHYPHHFIMHLTHCAEVVGYFHPDFEMRSYWKQLYLLDCASFHMERETAAECKERLNDFGCGVIA